MRERLRLAAEAVAAAIFALLFLVFIVQVGMRFLFNRPLAWSDELIVILYIAMVFWSAATLLKERDHVMLDLVYEVLPPGGKRVELQFYARGKWRTFASVATRGHARWGYTYRFDGSRGTVRWRFRAQVTREADYPYVTGHSRRVAVTVTGLV